MEEKGAPPVLVLRETQETKAGRVVTSIVEMEKNSFHYFYCTNEDITRSSYVCISDRVQLMAINFSRGIIPATTVLFFYCAIN